ncbi:MAG: MerR family DNA-binding transcriptional regulator [Dehalococcoidia bacterium]|nr:MerR family DNA-binding transcriptional regulator [Dehalococcoidia bacterium]
MVKVIESDKRQWVPLGAACKVLEVNEATLRRWADRGLIRSYRTPGGHRRFSQGDLRALVAGTSPVENEDTRSGVMEAALRHIRRRLHHRSMVNQSWYGHIHEENRGRMRLFGYRLLTVASDYMGGHGHRSELLASARLVGEEYATETARLGLPLVEATQAFIFFRNSLVEGLQSVDTSGNSPGAVYRKWEQVNAVTDEVLKGIVRAYQEAGARVAVNQAG